MLTIGVDPHKRTHSAVAVDQVGTEVSGVTESAARDGFGALLRWSRSLPDWGVSEFVIERPHFSTQR